MKIKKDQFSEHQYEIVLTIDFAGITDEQMAEWAFADRKIALARRIRSNWNDADLENWESNGLTIMATELLERAQVDPVASLKRQLAEGKITQEELLERLGLKV